MKRITASAIGLSAAILAWSGGAALSADHYAPLPIQGQNIDLHHCEELLLRERYALAGRDFKEEYRVEGCKVKREGKANGEYQLEIKCERL